MINSIYIDNFKSLSDFHMKFGKFNCLIGLNGSGKSTVLQAMDFLARLVYGRIDDWLEKRHWDKSDLNCKLTRKQNISFEISFDLEQDKGLVWKGEFNRQRLYCSSESISIAGKLYLKVADGKYAMNGKASTPISFEYQGSILSVLKERQPYKVLSSFKTSLLSLKSMDLLSPHLLRQKARASEKNLGLGGEKLSAFLHELSVEKKNILEKCLREYYPHFSGYQTKSLRSGWKKLLVQETFGTQTIETEARHINDGMLRIFAIVAQTQADHSFLLFDEIEDGINPELIETLVEFLVNTPQQILVTTHSPMILNYLEDDIAIQDVTLIYKNAGGLTRSQPFYQIPSMAKKLTVMGPGEVFVDTELVKLVDELIKENERDTIA